MTIPTKKFHGHVFERDYQHLPGRRETFERFDDVSHQVMWLNEDINKWRASKHHGHGSAVESATLKENEGVGSDVGGMQRMRENGPSCSGVQCDREVFRRVLVESNQITSSCRYFAFETIHPPFVSFL